MVGRTFGSIVERRGGTSVGGASGPFAETIDTPFYRLHKPAELAVLVLILLSHGCPTQAMVAAFGLDERTVARWLARAGQHCQRVHEHLVEQGQVDLQHVQADEVWVNQVGGKVWMALALAVPTRLWLGGVISRHRDLPLITRLVQRVRACAVTPAILVCVSAGPTTASACSLPTTRLESGSSGPQPWRPGSPTIAGRCTTCSASRSPFLAGSHPNDAAGHRNIPLSEQWHPHAPNDLANPPVQGSAPTGQAARETQHGPASGRSPRAPRSCGSARGWHPNRRRRAAG